MLKLSLKCHKHPGYNPARSGLSKIKGGCEFCFALYQIAKNISLMQAAGSKVAWDSCTLELRIPVILAYKSKLPPIPFKMPTEGQQIALFKENQIGLVPPKVKNTISKRKTIGA